MQGNFFTRIDGVWRFTFLQLMRYFWGWLFFSIAQVFFLAFGAACAALGVMSLIGFDSTLLCGQCFGALEQSSGGVISSGPLVVVLRAFASKPLGLLILLVGCVSFCYGLWLNFGVNRIAYRLSQPGASSERLFWSMFSIELVWFLRVVGASLLLMVIMLPAFVAFIIPGVFLMIRLIAVFPIMATDATCTIRQAFVRSWRLTASLWPLALWFFLGLVVIHLCLASYIRVFFSVSGFALARFALFNEMSEIASEDAQELVGA